MLYRIVYIRIYFHQIQILRFCAARQSELHTDLYTTHITHNSIIRLDIKILDFDRVRVNM